jgi:hypothetical protein
MERVVPGYARAMKDGTIGWYLILQIIFWIFLFRLYCAIKGKKPRDIYPPVIDQRSKMLETCS